MDKELKLFQAIFHTKEMIKNKTAKQDQELAEIQTANKLYSLLDGQKAIVMPSCFNDREYDLIGLIDQKLDKEIRYLIEQDPEIGRYINQREEFDRDYDSGEYCGDGNFCLKEECVEIIPITV